MMNTEFPKSDNQFIRADMFQDQEIPMTYKGWEKKGNEDRKKGDQIVSTWKQNVKYMLRYSYPEMAIDKDTGEKLLGKDSQPFRNKYYDPLFPKGYTIVYHFEEGVLDSGSLPLFNEFCLKRPQAGEVIHIMKTGKEKETKWRIRRNIKPSSRVDDLPEIQLQDIPPSEPNDEDVPF